MDWSKKKIFAVVALMAIGTLVSFRLYYNLTDDFRLGNMTHELPHRDAWNIPIPSLAEQSKIERILSQKFTYIGKGAQSYAFGSEDGKYVLKFFKFKHLKPSVFLNLLPPIPPFEAYSAKQAQRKLRKLEGVFAGYRLAYEVHKEESGIVYIHLNRSKGLHKSVSVYDKIGRRHPIELDDVVFVLQEKAKTMRQVMHELLLNGDITLAKHRIHQIFDLYVSEYQKGIFDHDHGVMHNTGFVGDVPIHLDVGKLKSNPAMRDNDVYALDLELVARRMDKWLKENEPEHYSVLAEEIEHNMSRLTNKPFKL